MIGFEAPIMEEFIAVVYFTAIKNSTWYPNIPTKPVNKNTGISFLVSFLISCFVYFIIPYRIMVAIKNLKKVNVKGGIKGEESFAAIKAPAQNIVESIIKEYIFKFDKLISPFSRNTG